jgi:ubiquinone/menaquinone biosynthesis C-methylase UbiE
MDDSPTVQDVENFWDENPLFTGEVSYNDLKELFDKHNSVYFDDVFASINYQDTFYLPMPDQQVLDLGCGIGFWLSMFESSDVTNLTGVDISKRSIAIAKHRVSEACNIIHGNAEALPFENETFDHVNCQGVVHHTPDTQKSLDEIYRVIRRGGSASVSVYYDNILLKSFVALSPLIKLFFKLFGNDTGRGRDFSKVQNKDDLVRLYDGMGNPIGKSYTKKQFEQMLKNSGFTQMEFKYFFFPFRFISFPIPRLG